MASGRLGPVRWGGLTGTLAFLVAGLQADCSAVRSPSSGTTVCAAQNHDFEAAVAELSAAPPLLDSSAYLGQVRKTAADATTAARLVKADADQLTATLGQLEDRYSRLALCRAGARGRTGAQRVDDQERAAARRAESIAAEKSSRLRRAAAELAAAAPESRVKAAKELALPPPPDQAFVVLATAPIHSAPNHASGTIAELRRGMRPHGPNAAPVEGWVAIALNDGSIGYVEAQVLEPVALNPSARTPARDRLASAAAGDPIASLVVDVERSLPAEAERLASVLDGAGSGEPPAAQLRSAAAGPQG